MMRRFAFVVLRDPEREFTVVVRLERLVLVVLREPERFERLVLVVLRLHERMFTAVVRLERLVFVVLRAHERVSTFVWRVRTTPERTERLLLVILRAHESTVKFEAMTHERVEILSVFCAVVQEREFTVVVRFERLVFVVATTPERAPISPVC